MLQSVDGKSARASGQVEGSGVEVEVEELDARSEGIEARGKNHTLMPAERHSIA
jgi:hypothetical protein